jgi:outer membrane protein
MIFKTLMRLCLSTACILVHAQENPENGFQGDVGLAWLREATWQNQSTHDSRFMPYVYGDWGRLFARVDTFGVKVLPVAAGHLEIVYRNSNEGKALVHSSASTSLSRDNPQLWGLGTFQETPVGGFFAYALKDLHSQGYLFEWMYAIEIKFAGANVYPQLGIEHRSASFVKPLYGVSVAEANALGRSSYNPGASTSKVWGVALEVPLQNQWNLNWELSQKHLDKTLSQSPLVSKSTSVSHLVLAGSSLLTPQYVCYPSRLAINTALVPPKANELDMTWRNRGALRP